MKYIKIINRSIFKRVRHRILNDEFQKPFTVKTLIIVPSPDKNSKIT